MYYDTSICMYVHIYNIYYITYNIYVCVYIYIYIHNIYIYTYNINICI